MGESAVVTSRDWCRRLLSARDGVGKSARHSCRRAAWRRRWLRGAYRSRLRSGAGSSGLARSLRDAVAERPDTRECWHGVVGYARLAATCARGPQLFRPVVTAHAAGGRSRRLHHIGKRSRAFDAAYPRALRRVGARSGRTVGCVVARLCASVVRRDVRSRMSGGARLRGGQRLVEGRLFISWRQGRARRALFGTEPISLLPDALTYRESPHPHVSSLLAHEPSFSRH